MTKCISFDFNQFYHLDPSEWFRLQLQVKYRPIIFICSTNWEAELWLSLFQRPWKFVYYKPFLIFKQTSQKRICISCFRDLVNYPHLLWFQLGICIWRRVPNHSRRLHQYQHSITTNHGLIIHNFYLRIQTGICLKSKIFHAGGF